MMKVPVAPFTSVSEAELQEVEGFCERSGLDQIGRICAELRTLRAEYLSLSVRVGKQGALIQTLESDPQKRFAKEIDFITGANNAPPSP